MNISNYFTNGAPYATALLLVNVPVFQAGLVIITPLQATVVLQRRYDSQQRTKALHSLVLAQDSVTASSKVNFNATVPTKLRWRNKSVVGLLVPPRHNLRVALKIITPDT